MPVELGDQLVEVHIQVPDSVTPEQRALLEQLQASLETADEED